MGRSRIVSILLVSILLVSGCKRGAQPGEELGQGASLGVSGVAGHDAPAGVGQGRN